MSNIANIQLNDTVFPIKDSVSRSHIAEIEQTLAANGFFTDDITVIECGTGKTYTSLINAVDAATALNGQPCIIKIYEGSYDVSAASGNGLVIPDNCYLVGIGVNTSVRISGIKSSAYWSPINLTTNNGLYNLYVYAANCRYVIHDDADIHMNYSHRIIKNCIFEGSNLQYTYVYGAGLKAGTNLEIIDTIFMNDTSAGGFSIHNMTAMNDTADITLDKCQFYVTAVHGTFPETLRFAGVMNYESSTVWKYVHVNITNCENVYISLDTEYADPNAGKISPFYIFGNGIWAIRLLNSTVWEPQKLINGDMFLTGPSYDGSEYVGASAFVTGSVIAKMNWTSLRPPFSDGIVVKAGGTIGSQAVINRYKGILPKTAIGLSGNDVNKAVTINTTDGSPDPAITEFNAISGKIVIGVITDYGYVKLCEPYLA